MISKKYLIISVVSVWVISTLSFVWYLEYVKNYWDTLILKAEPVDPRDILRWDYVILSFPDLRPNTSSFSWTEIYASYSKWQDNKLVWSILFSRNKPENSLFIKWKLGKTRWWSDVYEYWFESYFVPEWRWLEIERAIREHQVEAVLSIDKSWRWIVKEILISWKVWKP